MSTDSEAFTEVLEHLGQVYRTGASVSFIPEIVARIIGEKPARHSCGYWLWGETCSSHVFGTLVLLGQILIILRSFFALLYIIFMNKIYLKGSIIVAFKNLLIFKTDFVGVIGSS